MNQFRCYSKKSITVFFISVICLSAVAECLICKAIVYESESGHTKEYAELLGEKRLRCPL